MLLLVVLLEMRAVTTATGCASTEYPGRSALLNSMVRMASSSASCKIRSRTGDGNMDATIAEVLTAMAMTFRCR